LEGGVGVGVPPTLARRHGHRACELRELRAAARVDDRLLVLDGRPLGVSRHGVKLRMHDTMSAPTPDIFKAYDIRGLYGEQLDGDTAEQIGRAFARVLSRLEGKPVDQLRGGLRRG